MLVHTDQKPFECDQCDQSFRQKQLLKRHINLYHDPNYVAPSPLAKNHACPSCERAFRHKGNLIRHMAMHDPDPKLVAESNALKIGRAKRVSTIDGQRVEIYLEDGGVDTNEYEDEEDYEQLDADEDGEMEEIYVEEGDEEGDQESYVMMEVVPEEADRKVNPIHIEDLLFEESEFYFYIDFLVKIYLIYNFLLFFVVDFEDDTLLPSVASRRKNSKETVQSLGKDNCFGFDVSWKEIHEIIANKYIITDWLVTQDSDDDQDGQRDDKRNIQMLDYEDE